MNQHWFILNFTFTAILTKTTIWPFHNINHVFDIFTFCSNYELNLKNAGSCTSYNHSVSSLDFVRLPLLDKCPRLSNTQAFCFNLSSFTIVFICKAVLLTTSKLSLMCKIGGVLLYSPSPFMKFTHFSFAFTVPPKIINLSRDIVVNEGSNITLLCQANGKPEPSISWKLISSSGNLFVCKHEH